MHKQAHNPFLFFDGRDVLTRRASSQRHILVKGCGEASKKAEAEKTERTISPGAKSESDSGGENTPSIASRTHP